jgi:hypothetical protein
LRQHGVFAVLGDLEIIELGADGAKDAELRGADEQRAAGEGGTVLGTSFHEKSGRFFEKNARAGRLRKKLLLLKTEAVSIPVAQTNKSFFASFLSKKEVLSSFLMPTQPPRGRDARG